MRYLVLVPDIEANNFNSHFFRYRAITDLTSILDVLLNLKVNMIIPIAAAELVIPKHEGNGN